MQFRETDIAGVWEIMTEAVSDARGSFSRLFCPQELATAGIDFSPVQINLSRNPAQNTLRGMHYQEPPRAEAKLVQVTHGSIFDVAVDLRPNSPTFRKWTSARLDAGKLTGLLIPEGCAHGFLTLEPDTDVLYHMGRLFEPGWGCGVRWDDPAFAIDWPALPKVISDRDAGYADFDG